MNQNSEHINMTGLPDLLSRMAKGEYSSLQVFLSRAKMTDYSLPQDFLYVDCLSFGRVSLTDIRYCDESIYIDITDASNCLSKTISIDIDKQPDFQMIYWRDVVDMVQDPKVSDPSKVDLLEFCF